MQFLPIVQRELLVASRKRATYLSRSLSAGILLAFFPSFLNFQPSFAGPRLLQFLSVVVFLQCLLAGVRHTCDCLSEEKREGTLGLLFLTNLSGFDVVVGKMVAYSLPAIFNLVAAIPILAISVMIGGVTGTQIVSLSIAFLVITIFSLCLGAFISSRGLNERSVLVRTLVCLVTISLLPLAISDFTVRLSRFFSRLFINLQNLEPLTPLSWLAEAALALRNLSPLHFFNEASRGFSSIFIYPLWTLVALSAAFLAYSSWRIRHRFGEPEKTETRPVPPGRSSRVYRRRRLALPRFRENPILWLALGGRSGRRTILFFCSFFLCFGILIRIGLENNWAWVRPLVILGVYALHLLYKFLVTAETCRQLNQDKRSGVLELILTTPIRADQVVHAHIAATRSTWLPAGIALALMNFIWMTEHSFFREMGVLLPCSIVLIAFDSYALAWRSVLNSLKGERYTRTVSKTFFRVMMPPMIVIMIVITFSMSAVARSETMQVIFTFWTTACVIYDLFLIFDARSRLAHLRALAAGDVRTSRLPNPFRPPPILIPDRKLAHSA